MRTPQTNGRLHDERGAAAVEFALVSTILIVILLGIFQFGLFFHQYQAMHSAAREGARVAAVHQPASVAIARVQSAADPYELSQTPTVTVLGGSGGLCENPANKGKEVRVQWTQQVAIQLPLFNLNTSRPVRGTFRCE